MKPNTQQRFWLKMIDNGMSQTVNIPVIVAKGKSTYPVLGLTAAIHGNEINGIPIIHEVMNRIDIQNLEGTVVAVPGLNAISLLLHQRRCIDEEDLNRNFPGKVNGNRSQQYVWQINQKILTQIDYLIDMHTASFGRENTLYVRADLGDEKIAKMAFLQDTDIILDNKGIPSTNEQIV
ncbi:MAG: succinylglutamate desuccinylase/aspartoacylase family protein, partial [Bacteroidota bacterium]